MNLREMVQRYSGDVATVATPATHAQLAILKAIDTHVSDSKNADSTVAETLLHKARVATHDQKADSTVAIVATVAVAREQKQKKRWSHFVRLAMEHDVSVGEVQARFTTQDKIDLVTEPDDRLALHAKTIADAIHRGRTPQELIKRDIAACGVSNLVKAIHKRSEPQTCGTCDHFRRDERHANLGTCAMGEPEAACGLWDNDNRDYCRSWELLS